MDESGKNMYHSWAMIEHAGGIDISFVMSKISYLAPYWQSDLDNRPYGRLYYVRKGEGFIRSFGRRYDLTPGRLYLIPPRGDHAYGFVRDLEIWWVHFTATVMSVVDLFDYLPYRMETRAKNVSHVERQMLRMIDICMEEGTSARFEAGGILMQFLGLFMKDPPDGWHAKRRERLSRFVPVLEYIDEHLGERIPIGRLAGVAHYESAYFTTLFTKLFGIAPSRYVNRRRVERAQLMLRTTNATLDRIAAELGFGDGFHLSKTFKKYTGFSPREFRRRQEEALP